MKKNESREAFDKFIDEFMDPELELTRKVKEIFDKWWCDFIKLPASSSGKYHHPVENYKPFGLLNHTMRTVWFANELAKEEQMSEIQTPKVIAASFLHDIGKIKTFASSHGKDSAIMIDDIIDDIDVLTMVQRHMHMWSEWPAVTVLTIMVAYADYLASRPDIEITSLKYFKENKENLVDINKIKNESFNTSEKKLVKEEKKSKKIIKKRSTLMDF